MTGLMEMWTLMRHRQDVTTTLPQLYLGDDKEVHWRLWRDVPECQRLVILIDNCCRDLLADDLKKTCTGMYAQHRHVRYSFNAECAVHLVKDGGRVCVRQSA